MEFKESHEEVTFSKLHKSTKPEKNNMYHKRRGQQHRLYNGEGSANGERKEDFFIVFTGKWDVIEGKSGNFFVWEWI